MVPSTGASAPISTTSVTSAAGAPMLAPPGAPVTSPGASTSGGASPLSAFLALFAQLRQQPTAATAAVARAAPTTMDGALVPTDAAGAEPLLDGLPETTEGAADDDDTDDDDAGMMLDEILAAASAVAPQVAALANAPQEASKPVTEGLQIGDDLLDGSGDGTPRNAPGAQDRAQHALALRFANPALPATNDPQSPDARLAALAVPATALASSDHESLLPQVTSTSSTSAATAAATGAASFSQPVAPPADAAAAARTIHTPVGQAAWADELGAKVSVLAHGGQHSASLRLSPEHLGPLEVRISVNEDNASVWFGAQHADTRAALNEALPRLRELFAAQGMLLADAGVSREAPRQDNAPARAPQPDGAELASDETTTSVVSVTRVTRGLIDTYA